MVSGRIRACSEKLHTTSVAFVVFVLVACNLIGASTAYGEEASDGVLESKPQAEYAVVAEEYATDVADTEGSDFDGANSQGEELPADDPSDEDVTDSDDAICGEAAAASVPMPDTTTSSELAEAGEEATDVPAMDTASSNACGDETVDASVKPGQGAQGNEQLDCVALQPKPEKERTASPKRANTSVGESSVRSLKQGLYVLAANAKRTLVIGVKGGSKKSGASATLGKSKGKTSQFWWIFVASAQAGTYFIESAHGGKVLTAGNLANASESRVRLGSYSGELGQQWIPVKLSGKRLGFKNALTGCLLALPYGKTKNGATVVQQANSPQNALKLVLVKKKANAKNTDLGRALQGFRARGVVVGGVKWASNVAYPKTSVSATTAQGKAITGSRIAPRLVQTITVSERFLAQYGSNPQAAFDAITKAISKNGS